jgi:hypothetical protein
MTYYPLRVTKEQSRRQRAHEYGCATCERFDSLDDDPVPVTSCSICKVTWGWSVSYIPTTLRSFLNVDEICSGCRASIRDVVGLHWALCWEGSPERALEWALADWMAGPYWRLHFPVAAAGFETYGDYCADMARRGGWG